MAAAVVLHVHLPADTTAMLKTPQHDKFAILWRQYIVLMPQARACNCSSTSRPSAVRLSQALLMKVQDVLSIGAHPTDLDDHNR